MLDNKVLFITYNFPPAANVGIFRALRFVKYLPKVNWQPIVLTSQPEAHQRLDGALEAQIPHGTVVKRIPIARVEDLAKQRIRSALSLFRRNGRTVQAKPEHAVASSSDLSEKTKLTLYDHLKEVLFATPDSSIGWKRPAVKAALELIEEHQPSVIFASGPPFTTLLVATEAARLTSLPLVLDFRDPWTRVPWGPRNKSLYSQRRAIQLEKMCVNRAALVILNTQALERDFINHYRQLSPTRFATITNGYDRELKDQVSSILSTQTSEKTRPAFRILHPGSLYRRRNPQPILHALAILKERGQPVVFEQLGHCDTAFQASELANTLKVSEQFRLEAAVSHDEMLHRMADVDAFLLVQPDTAVQVPGKLFEMLLYRKPIIALTGEGALADIIRQYDLGRVADPSDPMSIANAIQQTQHLSGSSLGWENALRAFDGEELSSHLAERLTSVSRQNSAMPNGTN